MQCRHTLKCNLEDNITDNSKPCNSTSLKLSVYWYIDIYSCCVFNLLGNIYCKHAIKITCVLYCIIEMSIIRTHCKSTCIFFLWHKPYRGVCNYHDAQKCGEKTSLISHFVLNLT